MGAWDTVKSVAKETWGQSWFKWGIFLGLLMIAIVLPVASKNPDGVEQTALTLSEEADVIAIATGVPMNAFYPLYTYTITYALFPGYFVPSIYPLAMYEIYYSNYITIDPLLLYLLEQASNTSEYVSSLAAGVIGFFTLLGIAWVVGIVLKKREPPETKSRTKKTKTKNTKTSN
jgi:hypothetical protein